MDTLKVKKAWEVALGPIKGLPMTAIMMYMSGNSLQIFSIMMVFMAFKNPIMGILGTNQAFERFETDSNRTKILQVKLAYVLMQFVALALGIWKVNGMGLLPWVLASAAPFLWNPTTDEKAQDNEVRLAGLGSPARGRRARGACVITSLCFVGEASREARAKGMLHMHAGTRSTHNFAISTNMQRTLPQKTRSFAISGGVQSLFSLPGRSLCLSARATSRLPGIQLLPSQTARTWFAGGQWHDSNLSTG